MKGHPLADVNKNVVYLLMFLFSLHVTPATYIESSFLGKFVSTASLGFIFATGSLLSIIAFIYVRPALHRFGNYKTFILVITVELISLLAMALSTNGWVVMGAFIAGYTMRNLAFFNLDIFMEHFSKDTETGSIRGIYLTISSLAYVIGPLVAGIVLSDDAYWKIFMLSSALLLPVYYILFKYMRGFHDPVYKEPKLMYTARAVFKNRDMRSIFAINSILRFFYAWILIYTPIYLTQQIGFSISEVTFMIAIALVAFLILQTPLGYIADTRLGEKELLIVGFIILSVATSSMSFITSTEFWVWAGVLFIGRVGASMVEVMSESYFFKKIDSSNLNIISLYRSIRPFVYLAPLLASLLLFFIDIKYLFLILGIAILYGIQHSLALKDTR